MIDHLTTVDTHNGKTPRGASFVEADIWVLALVFAVSWVFRFLSTTSFHNDQYMHLAWANQVLGGDLPGRDFVDPGMPFTYLASTAAQLLLGRGAWAEAVLSFTLLSAGAALTCHLARRASGSLLLGLGAALVQIVIAPRLYSAPKIALPLLAVWAYWHYADRPSRRSLAVLAACTASAFLVRHDHGIYIWVAASVLLVTLHWPKGATPVANYSGCVALMLLPFFAYVHWTGGIFSYLRAGIAFSEAEYTGRRVDLLPRFDLSRRAPEAPEINIRWAPTVDAAMRTRVEAEHSLRNATLLRDQTWRYSLADPSPSNVRGLLNTREVEDTAGIDRAASEVMGVDETMLGRLGRTANQGGVPWLTALLKRENAIAWMYLLFTWVPLVVLLVLAVAWLRPSSGFHTGELAAPVAAAAAVLAVVTNQGFLRDPLDVRLADASAVTLVLAAWLTGRLQSTPSWRKVESNGERWWHALRPSAIVGMTAITIAVAAAGATLLSAAELGSLDRAFQKTGVVEGPSVIARGVRQTLTDLNTRPPIDGWLVSGDERRELKALTRYVRECTKPDDRLLVTWFAPEVYFYSERMFAAGLAFFYPGFFSSPAEEKVALARLAMQPVPIVLAEVTSYEQSFVHDHPLLAAHLANRYVVAGEVVAGDGDRYRVLTDRRAVPVRTSSPWSLPCFQ